MAPSDYAKELSAIDETLIPGRYAQYLKGSKPKVYTMFKSVKALYSNNQVFDISKYTAVYLAAHTTNNWNTAAIEAHIQGFSVDKGIATQA